jgi:hypothetical protein
VKFNSIFGRGISKSKLAGLFGLFLAFPGIGHATDLGAIAGPGCVIGSTPAIETTLYPSFETWLGRPVDRVHMYMDSAPKNWTAFESSYGIVIPCLANFAAQGKKINLSVPMLVAGATLVQGAQGNFDAEFQKLGAALVQAGLAKATLRIGWEFNGNWYYWGASKDPSNWVAYFRRIVTILKSTPGSSFTIDWCPTWGSNAILPDKVYPGDDVVDYIGMDVYDSTFGGYQKTPQARWNYITTRGYGLNWLVKFAALHNKPISIPEWGTTSGPNKIGGPLYSNDDPYYFQQMAAFFAANKVAYQFLFDIDPSGTYYCNLVNFPNSAAAYRTAFGTVTSANQYLLPPETFSLFAGQTLPAAEIASVKLIASTNLK